MSETKFRLIMEWCNAGDVQLDRHESVRTFRDGLGQCEEPMGVMIYNAAQSWLGDDRMDFLVLEMIRNLDGDAGDGTFNGILKTILKAHDEWSTANDLNECIKVIVDEAKLKDPG